MQHGNRGEVPPEPATRVVITGATSGLGAALAHRLARVGVTLALTGRDPDRLQAVAALCRERGAVVDCAALDVRDAAALAAWLLAVDSAAPVTLVIANAGVSIENSADPDGSVAAMAQVFAVNLGGALNTLLPLLHSMTARGAGQIALVSSIAALAPLPDAPAYSGSKAALLAFGVALREQLRPSGVKVNVIVPGYLKTGMAEPFVGWRPLEWSADAAARRIIRGLVQDRPVIAFPLPLLVAARLQAFLPERLRRLGLRAFRHALAKPPER